ncbi:MAG: DUF4870 domain-containing protein [Opitutales bacterium]
MTEETNTGEAPSQAASTSGAVPKDVQNMGMIAHLLGLVGFIGPLILYVVKKDEHPFIEEQSRESLNFQITVTIATVVCFMLTFVFIGFLLLPALLVANLVFIIIATLTVSNGQPYRYPIALRLLK